MIFNDCSSLGLAICKKKLSTEHSIVHRSELTGSNCWECRKLERPVNTKMRKPRDAKRCQKNCSIPWTCYWSVQVLSTCASVWSALVKMFQDLTVASIVFVCYNSSQVTEFTESARWQGPNWSSAARSSRLLMSFSHAAQGTPSKPSTTEHKLHKDKNDSIMPSLLRLVPASVHTESLLINPAFFHNAIMLY